MKFERDIPIYIQIMDYIKSDILKGNLKPNDKLISIRSMSEFLNVNPNTVNRAYHNLLLGNIIYTKRGIGYFINDNKLIYNDLIKNETARIVNSFINGMESLNFSSEEILSLTKKKLMNCTQ